MRRKTAASCYGYNAPGGKRLGVADPLVGVGVPLTLIAAEEGDGRRVASRRESFAYEISGRRLLIALRHTRQRLADRTI